MENNEQNLNGVILLASLCAGVASGIAYVVGVFKGMKEQEKLDEYEKDIAYRRGKIDGYLDLMNIRKTDKNKSVKDRSDKLSEEN